MKKTRFTETQIVSILKQQEAGKSTKEVCREHRISHATFYNMKSMYKGTEAPDDLETGRASRLDVYLLSNTTKSCTPNSDRRHFKYSGEPYERG